MLKSAATLDSMYASSRDRCLSVIRKSIISRTANFVASFKSSCSPMVINCVGVSAAWPAQMHILAHYKLKSADERSLHRGDIHLAVPLSGVPIAHLEQRARRMDRNVQRSTRHQILVVQISRVRSEEHTSELQ